MTEKNLKQLAEIIKRSHKTIALTGAGISVPSGIPDFRSPGGLWEKYDPMEVGTAQAIRATPKKVWKFIIDTHLILTKAQPNPAHYALAILEKKSILHGIITQNIDSLHQRAGSKNVIEYHGNFRDFYCMACKKNFTQKEIFPKITSSNIPPKCECGGIIRPAVVFFGENIPVQAINATKKLIQNTELIIIIGTSGEVAPANTIPRQIKYQGGRVIEINLTSTGYRELSDFRLQESADKILQQLLTEIDQ